MGRGVMSFAAAQARFRRLFQESAAWRLLRADNAAHVLAFLETVFADGAEVPFSQARVLLDGEIARSREAGVWQTESAALAYLNAWIKQGWLRELDGLLSKTDAAETALRFARALDERASGATASHLRIVQDAVRDLAVAVSGDVAEQLAILARKKAQVEAEMAQVEAGLWTPLDDAQKRERIREVHQLALVLSGDFRFFEDEIRQLDKALRVRMMGSALSRGEVLSQLMAQEAVLDETEAGSAFNGFFELLSDVNRATEFREQLRTVLESDLAAFLSASQFHYLNRLVPLLSQESERVFKIRRRTEQELRSYIESGAAAENRAIGGLLMRLERLAVQLCSGGLALQTPTRLTLPTGSVRLASPESMRLRLPDEGFGEVAVVAHENSRVAGEAVMASLQTVRLGELAQAMRDVLAQHGALSLAGIAAHYPLRMGMEELVACFRIARAVGAAELPQKEEIVVQDREGHAICAQVPVLLLNAGLFPAQLEALQV